MAEDHVKDWIEQKLDRGVDPDRIRKTLEKTGRDPDLVDEVRAPFDGEPEEEPDVKEDLKQATEGVSETQDAEKDTAAEASEPGSEEESGGLDSLRYVDNDDDEENDTEDNAKESGEDQSKGGSFSLPSIPVPSPSVPSVNLSGRKILPVLAILLVAGIGYGGYQMYGDTISSTAASQVSEALEAECSGKLGVGVNIFSVSNQGGSTVAEVYTVESAKVVLEVVRGGQVVGQKTTTMEGRGTITVPEVGNRVLFHEVGCEDPMVDRTY